MSEFTCNICGLACREAKCQCCGATLRDRGIVQVLSRQLFQTDLCIPHFPRVKSLRGLGISDSHVYADRLAERFDYRNTFVDRAPQLDIANPPQEEFGKYDFIISSEVFEHVVPPVEKAFQGAAQLLKPSGVLVLTTPYSLEAATVEHYPQLHQFGLAQVGGELVLVNRTPTGELQVFDKPTFHLGCSGHVLELRLFSEIALRSFLAEAGFSSVVIYSEDCNEFGVVRTESWSLPIAARRGEFSLGQEATREIMEHWRDLNGRVHLLGRRPWFRLGRKLGVI